MLLELFLYWPWGALRVGFYFWRTPINVFLDFFVFISSFSSTSLPSCPTGCSRLTLYIFWFIFWISHFFKEPWFLSLENGIRNQDLGTRCAFCSWDIISFRHSQLTEQNIYVFILTYMFIYIIFLYVTMSIYVKLSITIWTILDSFPY